MAYQTPWLLNKEILKKYLSLPLPEDKIQCLYVWIHDAQGDMMCRSRTLDFTPKNVEDIPKWYSALKVTEPEPALVERFLLPVSLYNDPFRGGNNKIVLCETYNHDRSLEPTETNNRKSCVEVMGRCKDQKPWFGFEQEFVLLDHEKNLFGGPRNGYPGPEGPHYYGVGTDKVCGRDVAEAHYRACLYAGIKIFGISAEVMPGQWECQVGTSEGVAIGDDVWMARFLLHRITEEFGLVASFDSRPIPGHWMASGAHANFSTKAMREEGGLRAIEEAVERLSKKHDRHIQAYDAKQGKDNEVRLSGTLGLSSFDHFTSSIGTRETSIRIPYHVALNGKGYLEDRRPAANCDPYKVVEALVRTVCLKE